MKKTFLMIFIGLCFCLLAQSQTINVASPNASSEWCVGSPYTITWTSTAVPAGPLHIILRKAGDPTAPPVMAIASNTANDLTEGWTIPNTVSPGDYLIRIRTVSESPYVYDDSVNFHISGTRVISRIPPERVPPLLLKFPRLAVSDIGLTPNADGFGIIFSYKNVGNGALPKASEVPVKPSYRVLIDGRETAKGFLFIPAFAAQPGWEQSGYFGGWIVFPTLSKAQDTRWYIGNSITVYINENKVMGMESHSLTLQLKPIALKYKYDLLYTALSFNWDTHVLTVLLRLDGVIPSGQKILVYCGGTPFSQNYFHVLLDVNQHNYSLNKKLAILGTSPITLSLGTFVCDVRTTQVGDMDFRNNEWFNCKFVYPNSNPVI